MKNFLAKYFKGNSAIKRVLSLILVVAVSIGMSSIDASAAKKAKINKTSLGLYVGATYQLKLTGTKIKSVKTSNKNIATVTKAGKVTAKKAGSATITLNGTNKKAYKCKVTVKNTTINKSAVSLYVGKTYQLKLTGTTINGIKTTNSKVAVVNKKGLVTAKGAGTATITLVGKNKKNHTCKVTVKKTTINATSKTLYVKGTYQLKLTGTTIKSAKSSNTAVATVTSAGKVTAVKVGTATITLVGKNGVSHICKVTVQGSEEEEEVAKNITISDISGLQSNKTGLRNDTLELSYGSDVGTPVSITWYRDSKILATYTDKAASYSYSNGLRIGVAANNATDFVPAVNYTDKVGKYWAVIKTADGKEIKSETIEITDKEERAVIKEFKIEDDYEQGVTSTLGSGAITYNTADTTAVATLSLNRAYGGEIYLYKKSDTTFTTPIGHTASQMDTGKNAEGEGFNFVSQRELVARSASALYNSSANSNQGIKYVAEDGTATYMWTIGTTAVTRGEEYVLVFDQTNIEDDAIGEKNENVSSATQAPYLKAPAKISVTKRVPGDPAEVTVYGDDGKVLPWLGTTAATGSVGAATDNVSEVGFESVTIYEEVGNAKLKASTKSMTAASATAVKGVITGAAGDTLSASGYNYYWAEAVTMAGIFGEQAVRLESAVVEKPSQVADLVKISMKAGSPTTAKVELTNVAAPATVYIIDNATYNGGSVTNAVVATQAGQRLVRINKGDTSAEIINGFSKNDATMWAVVIPDDTENFTRIANGSGANLGAATAYNVGAAKAITSYVVKNKDTAAGGVGAAALTAKDQFGDTIATTGHNSGAQSMTRAASAPASAISATAATAQLEEGTVADSGDTKVTIAITGTAIAGDKWYVRVAEGQYLVAKCTTGGVTGAAVWELSIVSVAP